jgi:hypothetical protein
LALLGLLTSHLFAMPARGRRVKASSQRTTVPA